MSNYIKNLLETRGWQDIEILFNQTIEKCNANDVNEELPSKEFKINTLANRRAAKMLKELLKRIKTSGDPHPVNKKSFK